MKYLVYFGSGIGDVAIIYPFLFAIRSYDPNSEITLLQCSNFKRTMSLRSMLPILDVISGIEYYSKKTPVHDIKLLKKLGRKKYNIGFVLQYTVNEYTSKWPMHILRFSCNEIVGFTNPYKKRVIYNKNIIFNKKIKRLDNFYHMLDSVNIPHESNYYNMINNESLCKRFLPPSFKIKDNIIKIISLVIGCTDFRRSWFYNRWMKLAELLLAKGYQVVILGGPKEAKEMQQQNISVPLNADNYIDRCNLLSSLAILSTSSLVIGVDTGLIQFAGVLGKKSLTLLGCTDYRQVLPYGRDSKYITAKVDCSPCFATVKEKMCKRAKCMEAITVDDVFNKAMELI